MRCLVTGASGFLGSWLVRQLLQEGHSVTVMLRPGSSVRRNMDWLGDVSVVRGSLEDPQSFRSSIQRNSVDVFFHLAWFGVTSDFQNHTDQISVNVIGSLRLWELARDIGCSHWIGVGSQAEYGSRARILKEDLPANPVTAYGVAKLATGLLTRKMSEMSGMLHTWVRLLAAYGPGDDTKHLIPSVIQTLLSGKKPSLTKGEQLWDYMYVADAANALCRIAVSGAIGTFNLASGETVQIRNLVEHIRDLVDPLLPLGLGDVSYGPDQIMHLEADISRLRSATGWKPEISLDEGLRRTVEWYKTEFRSGRQGF